MSPSDRCLTRVLGLDSLQNRHRDTPFFTLQAFNHPSLAGHTASSSSYILFTGPMRCSSGGGISYHWRVV